MLYQAIVPLHPTINKIWCPPELVIGTSKTLVLLKNPCAIGLNPVVASILSPVSDCFISKAALLKDSVLASEKFGVQQSSQFNQLDFLTDLFETSDPYKEAEKVDLSTLVVDEEDLQFSAKKCK